MRNHIEVDGNEEDGEQPVAAAADERPFDFQLARALDLLRGIQLFAKKSVN